MNEELYYDAHGKLFWRNPVERCVQDFESLVTCQAEEVFHSSAPHCDVPHDCQIRVWRNDKDQLAVLFLYDMTTMDGGAAWHSDPSGFNYRQVIILDSQTDHLGYVLVKDLRNLWGLIKVTCSPSYEEVPLVRNEIVIPCQEKSMADVIEKANINIQNYKIEVHGLLSRLQVSSLKKYTSQ